MRIAILSGAGSRQELSRQLAPISELTWCERSASLTAEVRAGTVNAVVFGLNDERGRSVAPLVVEIADARPSLPMILHTRIDRAAINGLLAVMTLGLRMECALRPFARLDRVVQYMLAENYRPGVAPLLLHHFMPLVPPALAMFVLVAILEAPARRSVAELATWSRTSVRTIERHLRSEGWAAAHVVAQSFSALDAVWLMTEYGWSARRVQEVRGFSHASGVTRLLATYAGTKPARLFLDGGFPAALEHVSRRLRTR
jgi:hypothetical protein